MDVFLLPQKQECLWSTLLQNTSGTSVSFPETILDSFTQRGVVSGLLFPLLLRLSAWILWSQELTWLLTQAALPLNEQKKNK